MTMLAEEQESARSTLPAEQHPSESPNSQADATSTKAEAGLYSEAEVIEEQARHVQPLKEGEDLLRSSPGDCDQRSTLEIQP